jgi:hypothetical protein
MTQNNLPVAPVNDLPPELEFTPIERRYQAGRNTITPDRQRAFIRALAETGSVALASKVIGNAGGSLYALKLVPGAESFAAAWDIAVQRGARQVRDILVDHAINGTPEYIYKDGVLVAERRVFNYRMMMWIVAHAMPEEYGMPSGLGAHGGSSVAVKKLKDGWRKEWEAEHIAGARKRGDEGEAIYMKRVNAIRKGFKREIATDPLQRAAWEILCGPTDWEDCGVVPDYDGLPKDCETNHNRPDMIVLAAALNVDTPDWGLLKAMEEGAFGPERQAEALEARRLREGVP